MAPRIRGLRRPQHPKSPEPEEASFPQLEGYAEMEIPEDNPMTAEKVALGKQLYVRPALER